MADTKKTIEIEWISNTRDMKRAMQESRQYQQEMSQSAKKIHTVGIQGQKDLHKVAKKVQKSEKLTRGKKAVQAEKALFREVKKTTGEIKKRARAYQDIVKAVEKLKTRVRTVTQEARKMGRALKNAGRSIAGSRFGRAAGAVGRGVGRFGRGVNVAGGRMAGAAGGLAMGGLMGLLGGAFGLLTGQLSGGYGERVQYGKQYGALAGTGGRLRNLNKKRGFGVRMGFGPIEMAQQALPLARATGQVGGSALGTSMALQRATTLSGGESTNFMGMLTQAGKGFGGRAGGGGKNELVKTLALGMYSGLDKARMPEFFAATTTLVQRQMGASAGAVGTGAASKLLAMLGASGQAGLQGARGGQVASALDQAIRKPGGGEAGQAFMLQAMGFGKPGGQSSYYGALQKQERGVFGAGNLESMFSESKAQYGGGQAQILALRSLTGLTIDQLEAVRDVVDSNMTSNEKQEALKKIEEESKSLEEQALDEMKEFGDTTTHMAHLQDRSIGIGNDIKESVERIQKVINDAIARAMPLVVIALEKIADLVESIYLWLQGPLADLLGDDVEGEYAGRRAQALTDYEKLKDKMKKGMPQAEANKEFLRIQGEFQALNMRMRRDVGIIEGTGEGMEQMYANIGRFWGQDMGTTDREQRFLRQRQSLVDADKMNRERQAMMASGAFSGISEEERAAAQRGLGQLSSSDRKRWNALEAQENQEYASSLDTTHSAETREFLEHLVALGRGIQDTADEIRRDRAGRPPREDRGTVRPLGTGRGDQ